MEQPGSVGKRISSAASPVTGTGLGVLNRLVEHVGEVGAYPHTEAYPHTLLFAHRVTFG